MFGFAKKLVSSIETQANNYLANNGSTDSVHDLERLGLRVLNVEKGSIAEQNGFESWFDFIISVNGHDVTSFLQPGSMASSNPYLNSYSTDEYKPVQVTGSYFDPNNIDYTNLVNYMSHEINVLKSDLSLKVWSAKGGVTRNITISNSSFSDVASNQLDDVNISSNNPIKVDSTHDGRTAMMNSAFRQLKLSLQLSSLTVSQYVWHVLRVQPNSPAYIAGIMPDEYVINCEGGKLATGGEDLLGRVLYSTYTRWRQQLLQDPQQQQANQVNPINLYVPHNPSQLSNSTEPVGPCSLVLYVYNHEFDSVRPATIYPNDSWGGKGLLGCDIGYGLLHRIPEVLNKYSRDDDGSDIDFSGVMFQQKQPNEELEEAELPPPSGNILSSGVHAPTFAAPTEYTSGPLPPRPIKHKPGKKLPRADLSNYFAEETAKSKEIDGERKVDFGDDIPLPPPPKANKDS